LHPGNSDPSGSFPAKSAMMFSGVPGQPKEMRAAAPRIKTSAAEPD
jgi:hypothetical protein